MSQAGKSTRKMVQSRRRNTNLILVGVLILAVLLALTIQNARALGLGGGAVLGLLILLKVLPDLIDRPIKRQVKEDSRANRGAAAEEVVGDLLSDLDEDFFVLHDISSPYGNIDHIVIDKNKGVFLLETKARRGRVEMLQDGLLVNSKPLEKGFIAQALKNTYRLRDEIEKVIGSTVWITPVVVFTNTFVETGKPIKGVCVVHKKFLPNLLHRQMKSSSGLSTIWEIRQRITQRLEGR